MATQVQAKTKTVKVRWAKIDPVETTQCTSNPKVDPCWACLETCEAYQALWRKAQEEFAERMAKLKEKHWNSGTVVEAGHLVCRNCPEKPHECYRCRKDPVMFESLATPYIVVQNVFTDKEEVV